MLLVRDVGDIIVLQGKSGCGKTTFLKCIAHLRPYKGELLFHGKLVYNFSLTNVRNLT